VVRVAKVEAPEGEIAAETVVVDRWVEEIEGTDREIGCLEEMIDSVIEIVTEIETEIDSVTIVMRCPLIEMTTIASIVEMMINHHGSAPVS
jgi:hypothetical protein